MHQRVISLILLHAACAVDRRDSATTQADVLDCLAALKSYNAQPHRDGLVDPALKLVEGSWPLLWARIELERHRRDNGFSVAHGAAAIDAAIVREVAGA